MAERKKAQRMKPFRAWMLQLADGEMAYGAALIHYKPHEDQGFDARIVRVEVREVLPKRKKVKR